MAMPIEVLRVEQSTISKELARFRACDPETRSLYCREWAQYIHKKHFVYSAKTQEDVPEPSATTMSAGRFQINLYRDKHQGEDSDYSDDEDLQLPKKDRSTYVAKRFEELLDKSGGNSNNNGNGKESLIKRIITDSYAWMALPSAFSGLPNLFEPVEFNPYPDHIPLVDDPKDPSQILDPLIIERQSLCLPSDCFHLLKNLTGDILLSHTTPTCGHTKPESKTPSDLEVERAIYNEHEAEAVKRALSELKLALENTWQPLTDFLTKLDEIETRRDKLMGKGCQAEVDRFFEGQKYVSFVDVFAKELPNFKNKKSTAEELNKVDTLFDSHFDGLKTLVEQFLNEFVQDHLKRVLDLTTDLWKLIVPTIYKMGERMSRGVINNINTSKNPNSSNNKKIKESLKALDFDSLKQMESTKEVEAASQRVFDNVKAKVDEYLKEIDALTKLYREQSKPTLSSRVDRLNNKDFKKKIKKLESGYYTIRQTFRYEITENIFPESLFCKFSMVCLEPLMQEGEVMEAVTIEKEVKRFMESHQQLMQQRCALFHEFEEGVQTGRRELAGILGKLFLKEGMRIQGDSVALKRQNSLLKSMGVLPADNSSESPAQSTNSSKKKAKKKKGASATSSGAVTPTEVPASPTVPANAAAKQSKANPTIDAKTEEAKAKTSTIVAAAASSAKSKKTAVAKDESKQAASNTTTAIPVKAEKDVKAAVTNTKNATTTSAVKEEEKAVTKEKKTTETAAKKKQLSGDNKDKEATSTKANNDNRLKDTLRESVATTDKKVNASNNDSEKSTTDLAAEKKDDSTAAPIDFESLVADEQQRKAVVETDNQDLGEDGWATVTAKKKPSQTASKSEKTPVSDTKTSDAVAEATNTSDGWSTVMTKKTASKVDDVVNSKSPTAGADNNAASDDWGAPTPSALSTNNGRDNGSTDAFKKTKISNTDGWGQASASNDKSTDYASGDADDWNVPDTTTTPAVTHDSAKRVWENPAEVIKDNGWTSTGTSTEPETQNWGTATTQKATTNDDWPSFNTTTTTPTKNKPSWGALDSQPKNDKWGAVSTRDNSSFSKKKSMADASDDWRGKKVDTFANGTDANDGKQRSVVNKNDTVAKGWGAPATDSTTTALGGWGTPMKSPAALSDGWGKPAKTARPKESTTTPVEWGSGKLPWEEERDKTKVQQSIKQQAPISTLAEIANNTSNPVRESPSQSRPPPGITPAAAVHCGLLSPSNDAAQASASALPPGLQPAQQQQEMQQQQPPTPGSSTMLSSSLLPQQLPSSLLSSQQPPQSQPPTTNSLFHSNVASGLLSSPFSTSTNQLQEPLPANLNDMNADMLRIVVNKLHQENGTLLRSVYSLQQDLSMMTNRYSEIMALAREREAQTLALFESKKQTEMEETRRYVLSLEARVKQLEEQAKNNSSNSAFGGGNSKSGTTPGFGSQDLFANYREEMSSSPTSSSAPGHHPGGQHNYNHYSDGQAHHNRHHSGRKLWQKNNSVIRCGNCGEVGHASAECKSYCRYCGSLEHLSEACPMN